MRPDSHATRSGPLHARGQRSRFRTLLWASSLVLCLQAAPALAADNAAATGPQGAAVVAAKTRLTFTKLTVVDLDAALAFYKAIGGFSEVRRMKGELDGRKIEELVLETAEKGPAPLVLWKWADRTTPATDEVTLGFMTDDAEAFVRRAVAAGGRIVLAPAPHPSHGISVAVVADPEGHLVEAVQMLSGPAPR